MSGYSGSKNSIPQILTGIWDDNSDYYADYSIKAYKQSKLLKTLINREYEMNYYGGEF